MYKFRKCNQVEMGFSIGFMACIIYIFQIHYSPLIAITANGWCLIGRDQSLKAFLILFSPIHSTDINNLMIGMEMASINKSGNVNIGMPV